MPGPDEIILVEGVAVTSTLRTVIDCLGSQPEPDALVIADCALHVGAVDQGELIAHIEQLGHPGSKRLRRRLSMANGLAESPLETLARLLLHDAGLYPELRVVINGSAGFVARVDFLFREARLSIEVDGFESHADRGHFRRDQERQNALVALGYQVLRFTWADVTEQPQRLIDSARTLLVA